MTAHRHNSDKSSHLLTYDKSASGIRRVNLNKVAKGYVAYCNPCDYSTRIMQTWERANTLLTSHRRSIHHKGLI